jgi:tetratricopeptide (TPR) repeat protein
VRAAETQLAEARAIAEQLRQPNRLWEVCSLEAMFALATGRLDEAEEAMAQSFALGERSQPDGAIPIDRIHRATLRDFRGGLEDVEPEIRELAIENPARVVFRCAHAYVQARTGRPDDAQRTLDALASERLAGLPFDQEWLFGMSLLAEIAALLGDAAAAPVLYELLVPWERCNASDAGEGIRGAVARYLGLLATTARDWEPAERHFEDALAMNARMGLRPWLAYTQSDYARMLLARDSPGDRERARDLLDAAQATYRELGMEHRLAVTA